MTRADDCWGTVCVFFKVGVLFFWLSFGWYTVERSFVLVEPFPFSRPVFLDMNGLV